MNQPKPKMPMKHSLNRNFLEIENEDLQEIERRREEAINKSSELRRRSAAVPLVAGLTASELTQHCKDCIKLSTENKINTKNAFSFLLIDAMAAMAKKADSEINKNFQVASCTLDASVKIYGYRVDAIHTDAIKMAGGVLSKEVGNEEQNAENLENGQGENEVKTVHRKKKKKKLTIASPESLNAKAEDDLLLNISPHQNFLMHKSDGNDLLVRIPKYNDNNVFYINSDYVCWRTDKNKFSLRRRGEVFDPGSLKTMLKEIAVFKNDKLCSLYHKFEFGKGDDTDSSDDESLPELGNGFEFDLNASLEEIQMYDEVNDLVATQRDRLIIPMGGYESGEEVDLPPAMEKQTTKIVAIAELKNRITVNQLEYSMFDENVLKAWAGPSYWKVGSSKRVVDGNKENEPETRAAAAKRTRKGKIIQPADVYEVAQSVLAKYLATGEKTTLNKSTMLNWNPQNVTVPKDCMYKPKNLLILFQLPDFAIDIKKQFCPDEPGPTEANDNHSEANEELECCSNRSMQDDITIKADPATDREDIWDERNMVAIPNRVGKLPSSTFRRRKNIDIKHLKRCLWHMITESVADRVSKPISFNDIMRTYEVNMPTNLATSLSAPLIFNALLHLTNEKCLILTQDRLDKSDFVVSQ